MNPQADGLNQRVDRVTRLLRIAGSLMLVASASSFMLQRWDSGTDVTKFLYLLAHTGAALVGGLLCGATIKESRAARTFLMLALALIPMNFAVAGGFVYHHFAWDQATKTLPQFASWVAGTPLTSVALFGLTALASIVVTLIAAAPLVRGRTKVFARYYVAANLLLVTPLRQPEIVGVLVLATAAVPFCFEWLQVPYQSRLGTPEGRILRVLLWIPALFVLGRTAFFYEVNAFLYAPVATAFGLLLFTSARRLRDPDLQTTNEVFGAVLTGGAWVPLVAEIKALHFPELHFHPLALLPVCLVLVVLSRSAVRTRKGLRISATVGALVASLLAVLLEPSMVSGLVTVVVSLLAVCYGMLRCNRWIEVPSLAVGGLGLVCCVARAVGVSDILNWGSLSALGVLLVFGAALLERKRGFILRHLQRAESRAEPAQSSVLSPTPTTPPDASTPSDAGTTLSPQPG